jgi:hypothetical protein
MAFGIARYTDSDFALKDSRDAMLEDSNTVPNPHLGPVRLDAKDRMLLG